MQSTLQEPGGEALWSRLAPLLDDAVGRLGKKDRDAVVLRFFKERSVREVATALQVSEAAAQRRVLRAMEKLRKFFVKRGVDSAADVIAGAISAHSIQSAPPLLAKIVTTAALAKGAAASSSTLTLAKGALKLMAWTKAKMAAAVVAILLLAAGTTTVVVKKMHPEMHPPAQPLAWSKPAGYPGDWIWNFNSQTLEQVPPLLILRPTQLPTWVPGEMFGQNRYLAMGQTAKELVARVYSQINSAARITFLAELPDGKFDCIITTQNTNWWSSLQTELNRQFNLVEQFEYSPTGQVVVVKNAQ